MTEDRKNGKCCKPCNAEELSEENAAKVVGGDGTDDGTDDGPKSDEGENEKGILLPEI